MEIGSEFNFNYSCLDKCEDSVFNYLNEFNTIYTNGGRSALQLLKKILKRGKILLPSYTCTSVIDCFYNDYEVDFYKINLDLSIDVQSLNEKIDASTSVVYIQSYFGFSASDELVELLHSKKSEFNFDIIEDTTHSIFTNPMSCGDYCICSLRKWFPITDGGVLYSNKSLSTIDLTSITQWDSKDKLQAMILKTVFLENNYDTNALYRDLFAKSEHVISIQPVPYLISDFAEYILKCCSIVNLINIRKSNYQYLYSNIKFKYITQILPYSNAICPFSLIVYVSGRDAFKSYLIQHKIYCAVHWPLDDILEKFTESKDLSDHIISLPIDQRYSIEEMQYLVDTINNYKPCLER